MYPSKKYNAIENPNDCEGIKQINNKKIEYKAKDIPNLIQHLCKSGAYMFLACAFQKQIERTQIHITRTMRKA